MEATYDKNYKNNQDVAERAEEIRKSTKTGVKPNTLANYNFVQNIMNKEEFGNRKIAEIKTSDAKLFLIKLQQDGKSRNESKDFAVSDGTFGHRGNDEYLHAPWTG